MKIIFLDIDGVLNNYRHAQQAYQEAKDKAVRSGAPAHSVINNCYDNFDPASVNALNTILQKTDAKIVISSAWRISNTLEEIREHFKEQGIIEGRVLSETAMPAGLGRGREIEIWVEHNKIFIDSFVIIDDMSYNEMEPYEDKLVQTNFDFGLRESHIEDILDKLGETL